MKEYLESSGKSLKEEMQKRSGNIEPQFLLGFVFQVQQLICKYINGQIIISSLGVVFEWELNRERERAEGAERIKLFVASPVNRKLTRVGCGEKINTKLRTLQFINDMIFVTK
ncbi:Hypothetical_protein [Hexamita inflata]|uniref:Hypothetical_protein n=1 Tax=Hexamita inflata TaxID=28002 RepID=A0AA86UAD4_9EUKA|nr:Hypothetical protein HINF_LOCUS35249 [Hexamita inflata]